MVTNVSPTSPLYDQFVRPGTIISEVNGQSIEGVADFEKAVKNAKPGTYVRLYTLQFGARGQRAANFAVVQVP